MPTSCRITRQHLADGRLFVLCPVRSSLFAGLIDAKLTRSIRDLLNEEGDEEDFEDDEATEDTQGVPPTSSASVPAKTNPPLPPRDIFQGIIAKYESSIQQLSNTASAPTCSTSAHYDEPPVASRITPSTNFDAALGSSSTLFRTSAAAPASSSSAPAPSHSSDEASAPSDELPTVPSGNRSSPKGKARADPISSSQVAVGRYLGPLDLEDELGEPDSALLGLMDELVQKASSYDLLNIYVVRCKRGSENSIFRAICDDIIAERVNASVVWNVYLSRHPGQVYLHVHNMLPGNTPLVQYLQQFAGFVYPTHPLSNVGSLTSQMPLHKLIPWADSPQALRYTQATVSVKEGDWVQICGGSCLYAGDIGVVFGPDPVKEAHCRILLVPCLLIPSKTGQKRKRRPRPPPCLYDSIQAEGIAELEGVGNPKFFCRHGCSPAESCLHGQEELLHTFLKQHFDRSLALLSVHIRFLKPAIFVPAEVDSLFRRSGHPWLLNPTILSKMPPLSDWAFSPGETVLMVNPLGLPQFVGRFGVQPGMEGVIKTVDGNLCDVSIPRRDGERILEDDRCIPQTCLRKKIAVGDTVEIVACRKTLQRVNTAGLDIIQDEDWTPVLAHGLVGSVIGLHHNSSVAEVALGQLDATVEVHVNCLRRMRSGSYSGFGARATVSSVHSTPMLTEMQRSSAAFVDQSSAAAAGPSQFRGAYTGRSHPWIDIEVLIVGRHEFKGYHALVKEIRESANTRSGLSLQVEFTISNAEVHLHWVDYDSVRRAETPHIEYFRFKNGYIPTYDRLELRTLRLPGRKEPLALFAEFNQMKEQMEHEQHLRQRVMNEEWQLQQYGGLTPLPSRSDSPIWGHWLFNPKLEEGLDGREMCLKIHAFGSDLSKDYRVQIRHGLAWYRLVGKGGSKSSDKCMVLDVDKEVGKIGDDLSNTMPTKPGKSNLLFVLIDPPEDAGKMGHRVGQVYDKGNPSNSKWRIQLVKVTKRLGGSKVERYDQEILLHIPPILAERKQLVPVWEGEANQREEPHNALLSSKLSRGQTHTTWQTHTTSSLFEFFLGKLQSSVHTKTMEPDRRLRSAGQLPVKGQRRTRSQGNTDPNFGSLSQVEEAGKRKKLTRNHSDRQDTTTALPPSAKKLMQKRNKQQARSKKTVKGKSQNEAVGDKSPVQETPPQIGFANTHDEGDSNADSASRPPTNQISRLRDPNEHPVPRPTPRPIPRPIPQTTPSHAATAPASPRTLNMQVIPENGRGTAEEPNAPQKPQETSPSVSPTPHSSPPQSPHLNFPNRSLTLEKRPSRPPRSASPCEIPESELTSVMHLHDVFDRQLFARAAHVDEEDAKTVQDMLQITWEQIAGEALELARPLSPEIRNCAREYVFVNNPEDYRGCRASAHEEWTRTITSSAEIIPYDKLTTDERHKHEDIDYPVLYREWAI
ncbi:hypothetical protein GGU10DRAFT_337371 [Lentinula aff. detonsa]|uniref:Chromatin elongation factor spt5 n=1 Tax=Lentinula aff. detonsa TaxID=2804958 RepID=A0AA38KKF9_9AGAR|nr:hypothetical protein GGU10DRAFT_337371 [Lentinula aff. detonsa]